MSRRPKGAAIRRERPAPPARNLPRYYGPIGLALILLAIVVVYWPARNGEQLWDDDAHITKPELQSGHGLWLIWSKPGAAQQYYPLLHSVFWIEHKLWGDSVLGYHVVNVLWHMVAVTLLYLILQRLKIPGALLATAIFALHPVMVESVAWISEQKNTLSAVFYLGAMLVYLEFDQSRSWSCYFFAIGLFVLGLLTKTVTATLPAALLVIFWWQRGTLSWKRDVLPLVPLFVLGAAGGAMTAWIERTQIGAKGADFNLTFIERGLLAGRVVWFYLSKLLWPTNLIFVYPRWQIDPKVWWQWLFPAATLGVLVVLWALRRKSRAPLAGWLLFVGTLVPVLGFLNVYPFIYSFVADHFQYLASLGVIVLAASAATRGFARLPQPARQVGLALSLLLIVSLAALTFRQARMYADRVTLYQTTIDRNPNAWLAHNNLGSEYQRSGDYETAMKQFRTAISLRPNCAEAHSNLGFALAAIGRLHEAFEEHNVALQLKPDHPLFLSNLSVALISAGRQSEAVEKLQISLASKPDDPIVHCTLGVALTQLGRYPEAREHLERALEILPEYAEANFDLGAVLAYMGDSAQAIAHMRRGLEVNPNSVNGHHNLGVLLANGGNTTEAIKQFEEALRIQPTRADTHNELGDALKRSGRPLEAFEHYRTAVRLQPTFIQAYGNLAQSLAAMDRSTEAIATAEKAIEVARSAGQNTEVKQIEGWLTNYRAALQRAVDAKLPSQPASAPK